MSLYGVRCARYSYKIAEEGKQDGGHQECTDHTRTVLILVIDGALHSDIDNTFTVRVGTKPDGEECSQEETSRGDHCGWRTIS